MTRTRKTITIEDKIEKAQQKVISRKARYDAAVASGAVDAVDRVYGSGCH